MQKREREREREVVSEERNTGNVWEGRDYTAWGDHGKEVFVVGVIVSFRILLDEVRGEISTILGASESEAGADSTEAVRESELDC